MAEPNDIERLRERIRRQRERLGRGEPVEVQAMPPAAARPLAVRSQPRAASPLASLARILADHPALAIGLGAFVLVAGPRRSLRLARRAVRGAIFLMAAYRGVSTVASLLPPARPAGDAGTIEESPTRGATSDGVAAQRSGTSPHGPGAPGPR